ncbi:hypothetical protein HRI_003914900 [Hibiscus trionum]|uniref:RRM domain-containing protein n=1 Tax=Hibiscus trionum TaxID=183268 RepID=A0A9W7MJ30_HIBTR|nr:hypothetical protein HRI_003914900 [Hibiscus trionum]
MSEARRSVGQKKGDKVRGEDEAGTKIFVRNVSKRIHRSILSDAFSAYGKVTRVYIAYNSGRRFFNKTTFAFVSFENSNQARKAIEKGNGRRIDGQFISVSLALDRPLSPLATRSKNIPKGLLFSGPGRLESLVTKNRSYKDALLTKPNLVKETMPNSVPMEPVKNP